MKRTQILALMLLMTTTSSAVTDENNGQRKKRMVVEAAPDFVRPYVLPKYRGRATLLSRTEVIRHSVTANSSAGAFSLVQHNGKQTGYASARFHSHKHVDEHVYCARGRVELWAQKNVSRSTQEARVALPGDYGSFPIGTVHTFQLIDNDAQLSHIFSPAGFEHLFDVFSGGDFDTSGVSSPYVPHAPDEPSFGPLTPKMKETLASLDLYEQEEWVPRRDLVNGTAGSGRFRWHDGANELLTTVGDPYFVAKDRGPKYLNTEAGYKIIQPLAMAATSPNLTVGTVIMSPKLGNESASTATLPHHFALQMEDGQLVLDVEGYEKASLLHGDVAFVPSGVQFSYHATVPFTKFLYINAGKQGLDHQLLKKARPWELPAYPTYAGVKV
ncbi:hypothetical protein DCS_07150 [Drechmeria coniospora]|uniref:Quercetin 2,3-dioxygenase n=1 Tax=Drechmeria coniospora TaxID=98403 RepID=A0A151GDL3_DRECN|nr:hypothetical protein DCS_07150 [Drechmeria coniospora]KYK55188.1 hypothetical protein DCS_07150 [Drechmeria coniospora]